MIKFEDERFYIGSRQSKIPANEDVKYWGSPVTYKHLWEDASLSKTKHILKVCDSFEEMRDMESEFIRDAWKKYPDLSLNRVSSPIFHHDVARKAGYVGGKNTYERGHGIHALTFEQRSQSAKEVASRPEIKKILKATGKKCAELGLGIHSDKWKNSPEYKEMLSRKEGPRSEETKKNQSEALKKYYAKNRATLGKSRIRGNKGNAKKFSIKSPTGEIYVGRNIKNFCEHMFDDKIIGATQSLREVIRGKRKFYKGWTRVDNTQ